MIRILERSKGPVVGLESQGKITMEDELAAVAKLDELIKQHGKISWLFVVGSMDYASLRVMYEDMMWLLRNLKHFDRMAVVGDKKWEELLFKADGLVFGEKYFDKSRLEDAWAYVEGK